MDPLQNQFVGIRLATPEASELEGLIRYLIPGIICNYDKTRDGLDVTGTVEQLALFAEMMEELAYRPPEVFNDLVLAYWRPTADTTSWDGARKVLYQTRTREYVKGEKIRSYRTTRPIWLMVKKPRETSK